MGTGRKSGGGGGGTKLKRAGVPPANPVTKIAAADLVAIIRGDTFDPALANPTAKMSVVDIMKAIARGEKLPESTALPSRSKAEVAAIGRAMVEKGVGWLNKHLAALGLRTDVGSIAVSDKDWAGGTNTGTFNSFSRVLSVNPNLVGELAAQVGGFDRASRLSKAFALHIALHEAVHSTGATTFDYSKAIPGSRGIEEAAVDLTTNRAMRALFHQAGYSRKETSALYHGTANYGVYNYTLASLAKLAGVPATSLAGEIKQNNRYSGRISAIVSKLGNNKRIARWLDEVYTATHKSKKPKAVSEWRAKVLDRIVRNRFEVAEKHSDANTWHKLNYKQKAEFGHRVITKARIKRFASGLYKPEDFYLHRTDPTYNPSP